MRESITKDYVRQNLVDLRDRITQLHMLCEDYFPRYLMTEWQSLEQIVRETQTIIQDTENNVNWL